MKPTCPYVVGSLVGWNPDHRIADDFGSEGRYAVTSVEWNEDHWDVEAVSVDGDQTTITAFVPDPDGLDPLTMYVGMLA